MRYWSKLMLLALTLTLSAWPALGDWKTATVGTGNDVLNIVVDPVRDRIFTANSLSGTVTVVNGKTNQVQNWVTGAQPTCLAVNPITGKLYVSINGSSTNDTVVVFDTTGTIIKKLPVKKDPYSLVLDVDNDRLYVANYGSDTISVFASDTLWLSYPVNNAPYSLTLNPVNHALFIRYIASDTISTFNLGYYSIMHFHSGDGAQDITVNAAVNKAYVANTNEDSVSIYDCAGIMPVFTKKIYIGNGPNRLVSDPGAKRVYVANMLGGYVTAINCSTNTAILNVPMGANPLNMSVNPVTGKLYVANNNSHNALRIVDWQNGGTQDSIVLPHPPQRLALNPVTNKIYVTYETGNPDSLAVIDGSDYDTTVAVAKSGTQFAAVNTITGDAFFSNSNSDNVTVIKANGDTLTIAVGDDPRMIAINPLTNKAFVCNTGSKSVSVINKYYAVEETIPVDTLPTVVAVNPLTNFIYVNSFLASANRIKVIDGKDWDTSSVLVGSKPFSIAVNPATNRIYVGNDVSNSVTVIDGAHHSVITTISSISRPYKIDVNPMTNKIYVVSLATSGKVTIIDGATNATIPVTIGNWPSGVAVNRANNRIYVTNYNDSTVTEIDGATNGTSTIKVGVHPEWIAADPVTGKVFVSNSDGSSLSIIDCASRSVKTMAMPAGPRQVAVNPVTGKVYLACYSAGRALVLDQTVEQDTKVNTHDLAVDLGVTWAYMTGGPQQNRNQDTYNCWTPNKTGIFGGVFSLASSQSYWKFGQNSSVTDSSLAWGTWPWGSDTAIYGDNILRRFALETQSATTNNLGQGTPFTGNILNTTLYRIDYEAPTIAWWDSLADDNDSLDGYGPYTVKAVITDFSGVDYATLSYLMSGKSWPSVTMTRTSADTFMAEIPAQIMAVGDTAVMSYLINTGDHANSVNNSSNTISSSIRSFHIRNLTGVEGNPAETGLPRTFALQAAYPNPSRGQAVIKYQLPKASDVQLQVYNVAGQLVKTFNEGQKPAGYHQISWNDGKLSNGIYFYKIKAGQFSATRKMVVLK